MKKNTCRLLSAMAFGLPLAAAAQTNPADPASVAPALRYHSAFTGYAPWQDLQPGDWPAVNDAVRGAAGGHGGHGPATAAPAGAATPPAARPAAPAKPMGGHPMHGGQK